MIFKHKVYAEDVPKYYSVNRMYVGQKEEVEWQQMSWNKGKEQPPRDRSTIEARELQVIGTAYFDIQQHFRSEATSHHLKLLYNS
jgi:hypothetical protein